MLKTIAAVGAIQVVAILVNIVRSKATAVLLGPEGVGVISIVDQVVNLVLQLSAFSLPFAAVKFLSRSHSRSEQAFQQTYASFLKLLLGLTGAGTVLILGVVWWRPQVLGAELVEYRWFLVLGILAVPVMALQGFFRNVLAAARRPRLSSLFDVFLAVVITGSIVAGILVDEIRGYYVGFLGAGVVIVGVMLLFLRRRFGLRVAGGGHRIREELRANPDVIAFALILYVVSLAMPLALLVVRYSVLDHYGEAEAGLLHAAMALALALNMVLNPANGLYLTPILNRDIPLGEKLAATLEFHRKLMIAIGVLALPIVLFPEWLLILLFSPAFVAVSQVVFLFAAAQVLLQMAGIYQALLIGLDNLKTYGAVTVAGYLATGGAAWLLVPAYGIRGAGLGCLAGSVILFAASLAPLYVRYRLALPPRLLLAIGYVVAVVLGLGALFAGADPWSVPVVAAKLGCYAAFGASLAWLFLDRGERRQLFRQGRLLVERLTGKNPGAEE